MSNSKLRMIMIFNMVFTGALSLSVKYCATAFVTYWIVVFTYRLLLHPLRNYPGPFMGKLTDGYGGFHALKGDLHLLTMRNHAKYGPVIRHGPNRLVFSSVEALHDIYENDRVVKSKVYLATLGYTGTINVFSAIEKHVHRPRRQLVGAAVTDRAMRKFEPTMTEEIQTFLKQILATAQSSDPNVDATQRCRRLGMDIIGQLAFGYRLKTQTESTNRFLQEGITAANAHNNLLIQFPRMNSHVFAGPLHVLTSGPRNQALGFIEKMINTRVGEGVNARQDFYAQVVAQLPKSTDMRKSELWSEALFLIPAGGDTTGTTLTAIFFYLSRNPSVYEKLAREVRSAFKSGKDIRSGPALSGCKYLRACIDEALRISPPVTGTLWRQQAADDKEPLVVDGHMIPRGTHMAVSIYAVHHNTDYFPEPYAYKPERWLNADNKRRAIMNKAFAPFSIGYRGCGGKPMAYLELTLTIAKSIFYFDFERASGKEGEVGGGGPGDETGRERPEEFQLYDSFTSTHMGPNLVFHPRDDIWRELAE